MNAITSRLSRSLRSLSCFILGACALASAVGAADRTKPTTPTNLRVTGVTSSSIALAWNPSTDNSGALSYTVKELNSAQTRTIAQNTTTYTWTGLSASRTYRFLVYARDAAGNQSSNSNTVSATTAAPPPLVTPANVRVTATGLYTITLGWDPVAGATYYEVQIDGRAYPGTGQPSYTFAGLTPGSSHLLSVRAWSGALVTAWATPITGTTVADTQSPTSPAVSVQALSPGMMEVSWTEATDDNGYVGYNVYVNGLPARSMLPVMGHPNSVTIQNLHAQATYQVEVRAYDSAGNLSAPVAPAVITMPAGTDTVAPNAPANLRTETWGNGISSVALRWDSPTDNVGVVAFEVYMDGVLAGEVLTDVHYEDLFPWFIARHLPPGTTHSFTVRARDEAGNVSAPSNVLNVTLQSSTDVQSPTAPTNLVGTADPGFSFVDFSWTGSTDNIDTALEYEVYADGVFIGVYNYEAVEGMFGRHRYEFRAVDRSGNASGPSNAVVLESPLVY